MPRHVQVSPDEDVSTWSVAPTLRPARPAAAAPQPGPAAPMLAAPAAAVVPPLAPAPVGEPASSPDSPAAAPRPVRPRTVAPPIPDPADYPDTSRPPARTGSGGVARGSAPNAILVAIASFFLPGLGQLLAGQALKGLVLMATFIFTCGGLGILSFIAAADAYLIAGRLERGEDVGPWKFF